MAYVFQNFVYNFLRLERSDLRVVRENISWRAKSDLDISLSLLPQMQTDLSALVGNKKVIVDTKYYRDTLTEHYGSEKIHSENLYQLFSYLVNAREPGQVVEGILLYPAVDRKVKVSYSMFGMTIRIETLNLAQPWKAIHNDLIQLLN